MKTNRVLALMLVTMIAFASSAQAAEYFVSKQGSDANAGTSRTAAFLTIQKGVNALEPGDTLTIAPGEYFENVKRTDLGSMDVETLIRAEVPGTALLRGDVPAPEFKKVEGYRFVYAAQFDRMPNAILEHNTMHTLASKANVTELEFDPGFFHYDVDSKTLYISNLDLSSPDQCRYTISVKENSGLRLDHPKRITIDGLAATGFHPGWGILLMAPTSCVVRNCVCFMNVGGIVMEPAEGSAGDDCGSDNLIEDCVCYGNNFGGIVRYTAKNDVIRNNYTYKNIREDAEHFGVMHYHKAKGPLLIKNNISWGHNFNLSVKPSSFERLDSNVGLGFIRNVPRNMYHNLVGGGNEFDRGREAGADNILLVREGEVDHDFEFADPLNLDFRLQPDSRYRNSAPDGSDRGPYQYEPNIFYVTPDGDDQADGLSMRKSWRTLKHAFSKLRPGDTLYLTEGIYTAAPLSKTGGEESAIRVLGRGRGTVAIAGQLDVTNGVGITFERLDLPDGVNLVDCHEITLKNCTFYGSASGLKAEKVDGLRITHSVFSDVSLNLKHTSRVFLSGNIYANHSRPAVELDTVNAVRYSDYNDYPNTAQCWKVGDATWSFADLQKQHDRYSRTLVPKFTAENGVPRLVDDTLFKSAGPNSTALGLHYEYDPAPKTLGLVGPFLHSVSDTTANIEWWSSHPATFSLSWGDSSGTEDTEDRFRGYERFNTFSLTGLKPGQEYHFKIVSADASRADSTLAVLKPEDVTITFKTAFRLSQPHVYHVAPDGNDANTGLSRDQAFKTVCHAANSVGPGDTVVIAGGDYPETVRIRAAGTTDRPITFRCAKGEKVNMQLENLPRAFEVVVKPDLRFDGLYFRGMGFWREGFVVRRSPRVQITRCFETMIDAAESPEMLVKNCVLHGGWTSLALSGCPDSRVENNVFIHTILRQLTADAPTVARRNVFCECVRNKTHQTLLRLSDSVKETDSCFYLRWPAEEKLAVNNMPLPVYCAKTGSNAFAANPMMPGALGYKRGWPPVPENDFDEFFSTNPELVLRDIGLQPQAFGDFKFETVDWPYNRAWAEAFAKASNAAAAQVKAGRDSTALAAYTEMVKTFPMSDRLKSDVLERAYFCARGMKDYDRAMELAKAIPVEVISMRRQMQLMVARKQFAELLDAFSDKAMGGRDFVRSFRYPELEDVMADLYRYRALAYIGTGNLEAAEADLRAMNDKRKPQGYRCGEAIHDLAWLRLGNFYLALLKDESRALEAYLEVCNRKTWAPWGTPDKPASTGASETLVQATEAACDILRKQGDTKKVEELQASLKKAQEDAKAAFQKE